MHDGWNFDNAVKKQRELVILVDLYAFAVNGLFPARAIRAQALAFYTVCISIVGS
jgi:hypothetical protein